MGSDTWAAAHRSPAIFALSNYFDIYVPLRSLIPPSLRRPLMNMLPSRRVQCILQTVDVISTNAVKIYAEKKREVESADQLGESGIAPGSAKDLMSMLRAHRSRTSPLWLYAT